MGYRIKVNIYRKRLGSTEEVLCHSGLITVACRASELADRLEVHDGFSLCAVDGNVLSFFDFTCISLSPEAVFERIKAIPSVESSEPDLPERCLITTAEEENEEPLSRSGGEIAYTSNRYECGASGFSEILIAWASAHPLEMAIVGGLLYDGVKRAFGWVLRLFKPSVQASGTDRPIVFSPKRFQKKASECLNIPRSDIQVIRITRAKHGKHTVTVRTVGDAFYDFVVNTRGNVVSFKPRPNGRS